jgi:hypothetical protein
MQASFAQANYSSYKLQTIQAVALPTVLLADAVEVEQC